MTKNFLNITFQKFDIHTQRMSKLDKVERERQIGMVVINMENTMTADAHLALMPLRKGKNL